MEDVGLEGFRFHVSIQGRESGAGDKAQREAGERDSKKMGDLA